MSLINHGQNQALPEQGLASRNRDSSPGRNASKPSTPIRKPKSPKPENAVTIAVCSRVLFNMEKEQRIYEQQGMEEYIRFQVEHEVEPFSPGPAFPFVKALQVVNVHLRQLYPDSEEVFKVLIMTNNQPHVGLRLINTINHHQLLHICKIGRNNLMSDLETYQTNLYLSADSTNVREALQEGITAATMYAPDKMLEVSESQLRVAFDGDGVLFSDESEQIFMVHGLKSFMDHERAHEDEPMEHGPLKGFLEALGMLQNKLIAKGPQEWAIGQDCPVRTYLVTARGEDYTGDRAKKTLQSWDLEIDTFCMCDGAPKGPKLEIIQPHIFFDDKLSVVKDAAKRGIVACHVPYGTANRLGPTDTETATAAM